MDIQILDLVAQIHDLDVQILHLDVQIKIWTSKSKIWERVDRAEISVRPWYFQSFFGVDNERIANKLNSDADYSELKDLPASDWPVSHCAYGPDFLVNVFSSVDKSTVRREVGIKLLASNMAGLANVDASSLVPSATDAHAARGRGIELALWQGVLGSERSKFGVRIGTGQMVRRKNATASESHRHGVVVGLLQQTDAGANYAKWLPGLWVITAFAVERGAAAAAAAATPYTTEVVLLPPPPSESDPAAAAAPSANVTMADGCWA